MLGMIDTFKFEMNKTQFDSISHKITFPFAKSKRIGNHVKHQAIGKEEESFTFTGALILQKTSIFDELELIAIKQEPVVLSFENHLSIQVLIMDIRKDMSVFLPTGEFIKQGFTIELDRWYP